MLPLFLVFFSKSGLGPDSLAWPLHASLDDPTVKTNEFYAHTVSCRVLAALTVSASAVLACFTAPPTFVIGLCSVIFTAIGLVLFEISVTHTQNNDDLDPRGRFSANGSPSRRIPIRASGSYERTTALRDFASAIAIICTVATCFIEPSLLGRTISWEPSLRKANREWSAAHNFRVLQQALWMVPVNVLVNILTFNMVCYVCFLLCAVLSIGKLIYTSKHPPNPLLRKFAN